MTDISEEATGAERRTRSQLAGSKLSPALAKLYSQHVKFATGQAPLDSFSSVEFAERLGDAVILVDASLRARRRGEEGWRDGLRRAAEILEWLAHPALHRDAIPLTLLSAASYHLAGYPARASTLAAIRSDDEQDAPLIRLLLESDFPRLLDLSVDVATSEPRRESITSPDDEMVLSTRETIAGEVSAALGVLCSELRWGGERRAARAIDKLRLAARAIMPFTDPYGWLTLRLVAEVASEALGQSLRNLVLPLAKTVDREGREVLERYVRGAYVGRRILAWPSQAQGIDRLATGGSFALCTPTGSGKTTVAEIALLEGLFLERDRLAADAALCLYLVPTRALAAEVEGRLARALRGIGGRRAIAVTALYGGTDWGPTDIALADDSPTVLVCTQEKAEALVRLLGRDVIDRLRLVVVDEAHEIQGTAGVRADGSGTDYETRSLRLESLIARLRSRLGTRTRFIALSAVAQGIQQPMARWISGNESPEAVVIPYRSTRQVVGRLQCRAGGRTRIELDLLDGQRLELSDREERAFIPNPFPPVPEVSEMTGPEKGLAPYALWAAMQLAEDHGSQDGQTVLISIAQSISNWSGWLATLLDSWGTADLPQFFTPPEQEDHRELWQRALSSCGDYFGATSREYRLLEKGVVVHHGKMPGRLPQLLIRLVDERVIRIVLATSTLSQGVNLPFQTVLVPGLMRHPNSMSGSELANLAGRAGRPGVATEGQTLVLVNENQNAWQRGRAKAAYDAAIAEMAGAGPQEGPVSALVTLLEAVSKLGAATPEGLDDWLERTAPLEAGDEPQETAPIQALDTLDAVIIACLEEAEAWSPAAAEKALQAIWRQTFARYAAVSEAELERVLLLRGHAVERIYADAKQREGIYKTGFPPREATRLELIRPEVLKHLRTGTAYATWSQDQRFDYVRGTINILRSLRRFAVPDVSTKITWEDVLRWWLDPTSSEAKPSTTSVSRWHQFIANHFTYNFNWALSAVLASVQDPTSTEALAANTDLPWAAIWLKDLLIWGTLDPVAAYLLARGGIDVRSEAEAASREYWRDADRSDESMLEPKRIREWVRARSGRADDEADAQAARFRVELVRSFTAVQEKEEWHVVPIRSDGEWLWADPAGVPLATGAPADWQPEPTKQVDFHLYPLEQVVLARRYI